MSLSSPELWQRIERSGLATDAQIRQWAAEALPSMAPAQAPLGLKVLQRLIELGKLTNYQAKIVAGQSSQPLTWGNWLIWQRVKDPIWHEWSVVTDRRQQPAIANVDQALTQGRWGRLIAEQQLQPLRPTAPSLPRSLRLATLAHPGLQATFAPELLGDGQLLLTVTPLNTVLRSGESLGAEPLIQKFASGGCSAELAREIVAQLADGLAVMHQQGLAHGRVFPDRIYWDGQRAQLAIDPLCAAAALPGETTTGLLGEVLAPWHMAQFIAPEFQAPGQAPSPSSDVYSLGCVWWWLLTGSPPASGTTVGQALQQHSLPLPALREQVQLPKTLERCLLHALGRNLGSRFVHAGAFKEALAAATTVATTTAEPKTTAEPTAPKAPTTTQTTPALKTTAAAATVSSANISSANVSSATVSSATVSSATATQATNFPGSRSTAARTRRRRNPWLLPGLAGCGLLMLLLGVLKLSGVLQPVDLTAENPSSLANSSGRRSAAGQPSGLGPDGLPATELDARTELFELVADTGQWLWAPPSLPAPLPLDLLPPGGQLYVSCRPSQLFAPTTANHPWLAAFDSALASGLQHLQQLAGVPLEQIEQVTIVHHAPVLSGGWPQLSYRVRLTAPTPLQQLKSAWNQAGNQAWTEETVGTQTLLVANEQATYYVAAAQIGSETQAVSEFSVGPLELMRDAAELEGSPAPLVTHLEKLWQVSDRHADLSLFGSAPFLFSEGRAILDHGPPGLAELCQAVLGRDLRGFSIRTQLEPQWYVETQFTMANARELGPLSARLQQQLEALPGLLERQLVQQTPHPYWRALALRYPHMMRTLVEYTRFGLEDGRALINCVLPSEAAGNILLASWGALHHAFHASSAPSSGTAPELAGAMTVEQYLSRSIRLSFDQEPIETALKLVGDEANAGVPEASTLRFVLDGDAFEKAGITRNQQLRDFRIDNQSVRTALTEIAKRGNPVTTVTDTRQPDQRLLWVVAPDPEATGKQMISLTTREAAGAAGIELPDEFR